MRIALLVGINDYEHVSDLEGCVEDATAVRDVLSCHEGGDANFDCRLHTKFSRGELIDSVRDLFESEAEIALFYFAGHGHLRDTGGYLLASDAESGYEGVPLIDILTLANGSPAKNRVIILDSCHSGIAGNPPIDREIAHLANGMTVLTASAENQYAKTQDGRGVFTSLLVDALEGGAASLTGEITPGSVYAHIDQSLGGWEQRPVFKTNVKAFVSLRKVPPPVSLVDLRRLTEFFPTADFEFPLDPSFEPELKGRDRGMPRPDPKNTEKFAVLQKYNRVNLLVPVGAPHMWHAAMWSRGCKLTALGKHYRRLVAKKRF